ncbi:DMT family transporter [Pseudomarimonas salicorniae]|uniref:DMT family transporter n=1 Tax=Pseudomarimonas salicorniae TaxID=2933270 RepID=A0ABT0GFC9_9GAMM|nr:DMT family transporter [Lysobacter sp. CAU 1642]MCK7593143.1 DMT family transporter [Lysobacter sp. CAU 1642]
MVGAALLFGAMVITIRLASHHMHPFEVAFMRNLFGLLFALPLLARAGLGLLRTDKLSLYFLRCGIGIVSMLCGFWAIAHLPLAQAVAISYSTPIFITIGAVLVLGEVVRARRWTAVALGFIGVMVIVRPGAEGFSYASLVALTAAIASGMVAISIKILSRTEPADAIVLFTTLIWVPLSFVPALFVWVWPSPAGWMWGALSGLFGTAAHWFWTRALRAGDASALTPISFLQLPVVAVLAWWLFAETPDVFTLAGSAVIFISTAYIARREAVLAKRALHAAQAPTPPR